MDIKDFTAIDTYEDCPCDVDLIVWTGDSFDVTYVDMCADTGTYYPANGVEFIAYYELPNHDTAMSYFDKD